MLVVHFLQSVEIQDDDGELLGVSFGAVEFLVAVFVEEPPVIEAGKRIGGRVNLKFFEIFILDEYRYAKKTSGSQHVHPRRPQRYAPAEILRKLTTADQDSFPVIDALRVRQINLGHGSKKRTKKVPASGLVHSIQVLHKQVQERVFGSRLRLGGIARLGRQWVSQWVKFPCYPGTLRGCQGTSTKPSSARQTSSSRKACTSV